MDTPNPLPPRTFALRTQLERYKRALGGDAKAALKLAAELERENNELREVLRRTLNYLSSYPGGGPLGKDGPYERARAILARVEAA